MLDAQYSALPLLAWFNAVVGLGRGDVEPFSFITYNLQPSAAFCNKFFFFDFNWYTWYMNNRTTVMYCSEV